MTVKKRGERKSLFQSIRKSTAPPTKRFGESKPAEKAMPSRRKTKHKKDEEKD